VQDQAGLSRERTCRSYASAYLEPVLVSARGPSIGHPSKVYAKSALREARLSLDAAIGGFRVQIGQLETLNQRVPGSNPGAPTKDLPGLCTGTDLSVGRSVGSFCSVFVPICTPLMSDRRMAARYRGYLIPGSMEYSLTQKPWRPLNAFTWNPVYIRNLHFCPSP
jgi:hypothetical protein